MWCGSHVASGSCFCDPAEDGQKFITVYLQIQAYGLLRGPWKLPKSSFVPQGSLGNPLAICVARIICTLHVRMSPTFGG
jgi:hypothetical protein